MERGTLVTQKGFNVKMMELITGKDDLKAKQWVEADERKTRHWGVPRKMICNRDPK